MLRSPSLIMLVKLKGTKRNSQEICEADCMQWLQGHPRDPGYGNPRLYQHSKSQVRRACVCVCVCVCACRDLVIRHYLHLFYPSIPKETRGPWLYVPAQDHNLKPESHRIVASEVLAMTTWDSTFVNRPSGSNPFFLRLSSSTPTRLSRMRGGRSAPSSPHSLFRIRSKGTPKDACAATHTHTHTHTHTKNSAACTYRSSQGSHMLRQGMIDISGKKSV
jgi:hypothetical protein